MQISNIRIKNANIDTLSIDNIAVLNSVCIQKNLTTTDLNTSMTQAISQYLETQSDSNINNYLAKKSDEYEGIPIAVNSTYNNKVLNYINNVVKNEVINNISSECLSNVSVYQNLDLEFDDVSINTINISNGAKAVIECVINNENVTKIIKTIMTDFYQSQKDNINLTVTNDSTKPIWAPYIKYVIYLIILIMIVIGFILFNKSQGK